MYLYETHCHCSQCSHCASSTSQELALAYYKAGYAGNHPGEDGKALALSHEKNFILTCGGDVHDINDPKLGTAGLAFATRIRNNHELVAALRQGADGYRIQGQIVSQVSETDLP